MTDLPTLASRCEREEPSRTHLSCLHDDSNQRLLAKLPPDQLDRVFASDMCDIEPDFLGFVGIYERLSEIIPQHWTVVDLGCAYAPQAFFFAEHRAYIGVDILTPVENRFSAHNSLHLMMTIHEFIGRYRTHYRDAFAICSYVPPWHDDNRQLVRSAFDNVFTFYPR